MQRFGLLNKQYDNLCRYKNIQPDELSSKGDGIKYIDEFVLVEGDTEFDELFSIGEGIKYIDDFEFISVENVVVLVEGDTEFNELSSIGDGIKYIDDFEAKLTPVELVSVTEVETLG